MGYSNDDGQPRFANSFKIGPARTQDDVLGQAFVIGDRWTSEFIIDEELATAMIEELQTFFASAKPTPPAPSRKRL